MSRKSILLIAFTLVVACVRPQTGYTTPDALAKALINALNNGDVNAARGLLVSRQLFLEVVWPAFPASDPSYNVSGEEAWNMYRMKSEAGIAKAISQHGKQALKFNNVSFGKDEPYSDFMLKRSPVIYAQADSGSVELRFAGSFVEHDGSYYLLTYKN